MRNTQDAKNVIDKNGNQSAISLCMSAMRERERAAVGKVVFSFVLMLSYIYIYRFYDEHSISTYT